MCTWIVFQLNILTTKEILIREDINYATCLFIFYLSQHFLDRFVDSTTQSCILLYHISVLVFINVLIVERKMGDFHTFSFLMS